MADTRNRVRLKVMNARGMDTLVGCRVGSRNVTGGRYKASVSLEAW